jgi:hypothetical protein
MTDPHHRLTGQSLASVSVTPDLATTGPARSATTRAAVVLILGLAIGCVTSILQKYLDLPWHSLVNAASPWLVAAFALGPMQRRVREAAIAGLAVTVFELVGYYATAHVRGYPVSHSILVFWTACAVVGGPIFGLAGWAWRRDSASRAALGAAVLPAAFIGEGLVSYGWYLGYTSSAVLFVAIGVAVFVAVSARPQRFVGVAVWLLATVPLAAVGEVVLHQIYRQSF